MNYYNCNYIFHINIENEIVKVNSLDLYCKKVGEPLIYYTNKIFVIKHIENDIPVASFLLNTNDDNYIYIGLGIFSFTSIYPINDFQGFLIRQCDYCICKNTNKDV